MTTKQKRPRGAPIKSPDGKKRKAYTTKLHPTTIAFLRSRGNAAAVLEAAIQRTKEFREWNK